jgi:hypothetical protein
MHEITMKEKLAVLKNNLASRPATTAFEQAILSERKRDVPAQVGPLYPRLPETNSQNQWNNEIEPPLGYDINKV